MDISGTELLVRIGGSATLLLWGARMTRTGMTRAFGTDIRRVLAAGTRNRFSAALVGLFAAAALQSSTAVAILVASFASAGALTVAGGLAIMLGADLGSALVAQVLSLKIQDLWPVLFFAGYVLHATFYNGSAVGKQLGRILMGLGCIFLSLGFLASTAGVVRDSDVVRDVLASLGGEPLIAIMLLALLTWLAHSSLAVLLLVAVLAGSGALAFGSLPYVMVLGVNAGAALPALMMGLKEPPKARRILLGNFIFRLIGVAVAYFALPLWVPLAQSIDVELGQQLILVHIAFNILLVVGLIGTTTIASRLLENFVPDAEEVHDEWSPRHLDPTVNDTPPLALTMAARETLRMVDLVEIMLSQAIEALKQDNARICSETGSLDDSIDRLYTAIKLYLTDLTRSELQERESARSLEIITFTTNLENAGDIIDRSLLDTIRKKIRNGHDFSDEGFAELMQVYDYVRETIHLSANVFMEQNLESARALLSRKEKFRDLEFESMDRHFDRLRDRTPETVATTSFHIDILKDLKRINSLFASVAYPILDASGELRPSRLE